MNYSLILAVSAVLLISGYRIIFWTSEGNDKKNKVRKKSYFLAEHLSVITVAASIFASLCGGFMIFAVVDLGIDRGITGYVLGVAYLFALPLIGWMIFKAHAPNVGDVNDFFGLNKHILSNYGPSTLAAIYCSFGILFSAVFTGQLVALWQFSQFYGDPVEQATLILPVAVLLCVAIWFGMKSVVSNDLIQAILIVLVLCILIYLVLLERDGLIIPPLESQIFGEGGAAFAIVGAFTLAVSFAVRPDVWTRLNAIPVKEGNERKAKFNRLFAATLACFFIFLFFSFMTTVGYSVGQNAGSEFNAAEVGAGGVMNFLIDSSGSDLLRSLGTAAIVLALATSLDSYLNLSAISLQTFFSMLSGEREEPADATDSSATYQARAIAIVVLGGGVVLTLWGTSLIDLMAGAFASIGILVPIFLFARMNRAKNDRVGLYTILVSAFALFAAMPFLGNNAFIVSLIIGWLFFGLAVLFSNLRHDKGSVDDPSDPPVAS